MIARIIDLYPVWPRRREHRAAAEAEARRLLREIIEREPEAEAGMAILNGIHRQEGWFRRRRGPDEQRPPYIGSWLLKGRWRDKPEAKQKAPAAEQADPGRAASEADWLQWAAGKIEAQKVAGKSVQETVCLARDFDSWWPKTVPPGMRERLRDPLDQRFGYRPGGRS